MFLIKKKYFYLLSFLTISILLGFSVWGYISLMNNGGQQSFEVKYIAESFIFTALLLISLTGGVFIYITHRSINTFKELDRIIDLFNRGNFYTQNSFKKLDILGEKILKINRHLIDLNDLKSKKISSDSKIINFLMNHTHEEMLILKNNGTIAKASKPFLDKNELKKEKIIDNSIDTLAEKFEFINIYQELNKGQHVALKKKLQLKENADTVIKYMVFFPIFNITNDLSNAICIFVSEGRFNKYSQMSKNPENVDENVYKSSSMMRKISGLFEQDK